MSNQSEKKNLSLIFQQLAMMKRNSEEFHKNYINHYTFTEEFHNLRLLGLNKLDEFVRKYFKIF